MPRRWPPIKSRECVANGQPRMTREIQSSRFSSAAIAWHRGISFSTIFGFPFLLFPSTHWAQRVATGEWVRGLCRAQRRLCVHDAATRTTRASSKSARPLLRAPISRERDERRVMHHALHGDYFCCFPAIRLELQPADPHIMHGPSKPSPRRHVSAPARDQSRSALAPDAGSQGRSAPLGK